MSERKFTLVEYHSHGSGPSFFPGLNPLTETEQEESSESADVSEDGSRRGIALLVGLFALVAIGVAVKYFYGKQDEDAASFEHQDVQVTEYED